jgi:hypothetical protein
MNLGPTLESLGDPAGYVPDDHPCFEAFIGRPTAFDHFGLHAQRARLARKTLATVRGTSQVLRPNLLEIRQSRRLVSPSVTSSARAVAEMGRKRCTCPCSG